MGIMDYFKVIPALFGAGQPKVKIELDTPQASRGTKVSGRIRLIGKKKELSLGGVEVVLVDGDFEAVGESAVFTANVPVLKPGEETIVAFEVEVPIDLEPSREIDYDRDDYEDQTAVEYHISAQPELDGASVPHYEGVRVM